MDFQGLLLPQLVLIYILSHFLVLFQYRQIVYQEMNYYIFFPHKHLFFLLDDQLVNCLCI